MITNYCHDHDPVTQVAAGNTWYTDDQFAKQLGHPGTRATIENRWCIFGRALRDHFSDKKPDGEWRLLDVGCGDGINLVGLNRIIESQGWQAFLCATDYNPLRVERASRFPFLREVRQATIQSIPYPDGWFDALLCNHVLEHIRDDETVLRELKRVLRPGGLMILGVPNEGCALARLRNHVFQRSILRTTDHVNFYTGDQLGEILRKSGFEVVRIEREGFFLPHLWLHYLITLFSVGRWLLRRLGERFPLQSAGLIAITYKAQSTLTEGDVESSCTLLSERSEAVSL